MGQVRNRYSCLNTPIKMLSPSSSANASQDKIEETGLSPNGAKSDRAKIDWDKI